MRKTGLMPENEHDKGNLMKGQAFNPYLPSWEYIPDGEPHGCTSMARMTALTAAGSA